MRIPTSYPCDFLPFTSAALVPANAAQNSIPSDNADEAMPAPMLPSVFKIVSIMSKR